MATKSVSEWRDRLKRQDAAEARQAAAGGSVRVLGIPGGATRRMITTVKGPDEIRAVAEGN